MSRSATGAEAGGVAGAEAIMRELYTRPLHASGRGGIGRVVLAAFAAHAVGRDELGGDEFDGVAVLAELQRPVVRTGAGFHADQARRQLDDQRHQIGARHPRLTSTGLPLSSTPCTANTFLARSIPTVTMRMDFPFRGSDEVWKRHHGTRCRPRLPPQPRDGEVPFIR